MTILHFHINKNYTEDKPNRKFITLQTHTHTHAPVHHSVTLPCATLFIERQKGRLGKSPSGHESYSCTHFPLPLQATLQMSRSLASRCSSTSASGSPKKAARLRFEHALPGSWIFKLGGLWKKKSLHQCPGGPSWSQGSFTGWHRRTSSL